ncbi:MAG TPA: formate dehydrogenase accessory sulfurtransferase FdhD [Acidimicrobiales bacterium]|nr:formate dehydrogenase accessory sulfurtransferase FdhD [Acidimicrobiales bacterium]
MTTTHEAAHRAGPAERVMVTTLTSGSRAERPDHVAGEEPLEIRLSGPTGPAAPVAVTMRTPGHDFELAVGFLLAEGLLADQSDLRAVRYCELPEGEPQEFNVVTVTSMRPVEIGRRARNLAVNASCGICGTATLDELKDRCPALPAGEKLRADVMTALPARLRDRQRVFAATGGLHAAGLFDTTGAALAVREDVGRHNAVDKLVGWAAMQGRLPLAGAVLVVSGRVSFEIVQKAAVAGIPSLVAVSAPSSLAVSTAHALGMTLAGFVREGRANLYSGAWRVEGTPA